MFKKILVAFVTVYALFGFVVLPMVVKPKVITMLESSLDGKVELKSITFNPFFFKLSLDGIKLEGIDHQKVLTIDSIYLDLEILPLLESTIHIKKFSLTKPQFF